MTAIINAAPMVIDEGILDTSTRPLPVEPFLVPQHLPVAHIYAAKGPAGRFALDPNVTPFNSVYGAKTLEVGSKYHTPMSEYIRGSMGTGNNQIIHRVLPLDIPDRAHITIYADVLETEVEVFEREIDGSKKLDANGFPVVKLDANDQPVKIPGASISYFAEFVSVPLGEHEVGVRTVRAGQQMGPNGPSQQYPLFDTVVTDPGSDGNNMAISLSAQVRRGTAPFSEELLEAGMYPYNFSLHRLVDETTGRVNTISTFLAESNVLFTTKKGGINPRTKSVQDFTTIITRNYIEEGISVTSGLGEVYSYDDNIEALLTKLRKFEIDANQEVTDTALLPEDAIHAFNLFGLTNSDGSPYQSVRLAAIDNAISLTKNSRVYMGGGGDGTMSIKDLEGAIRADMENYSNPFHVYNSQVLHPESMIYDVGYTMDTKMSLMQFIGRRKDTFVHLATYSKGSKMTIDEHFSAGTVLKNAVALYPESTFHNTPAVRAMIMIGSGKLLSSNYLERLPLNYEVCVKSSKYMGAANGSWVHGAIFDEGAKATIDSMYDLDIQWVPASTRNALWDAGLNFVDPRETRVSYFPALKTVYTNDTSVLNSYFVAVAACTCNKIAHEQWRNFTGSISRTPAQLVKHVNESYAKRVKGIFDGMFVVLPNAQVTEPDAQRGYSWHLFAELYANNMVTVMTTRLETKRMSDLNS